MSRYLNSDIPKRDEKIAKLKDKILGEIKDQIKDKVNVLSVHNWSDLDSFVDNEDYKREVLELTALYALRDYVNYKYAFKHWSYRDNECTVYTISDETINIMLQPDYHVAIYFMLEMRPIESVYDVEGALNDKFFEYEFINIFERCVYKDKTDKENK